MRRLTHALACLYALLALGLLRCALVSLQHHSWPYCLFFAAAATAFATAIVHHAYHRDELRAALVRAEQAARPTGNRTEAQIRAEIDECHRQLDALCCWVSFETSGAQHDSDHCTRKDHHA